MLVLAKLWTVVPAEYDINCANIYLDCDPVTFLPIANLLSSFS